jgi:hypothetical protein
MPCAPAVPSVKSSLWAQQSREYREYRGKGLIWWAHKGSNLGPLPCEGNALPLSYAPGILVHDQRPKAAPDRAMDSARARDLRSAGYRCQAVNASKQVQMASRAVNPSGFHPETSYRPAIYAKRCFVEADQGDLGCPSPPSKNFPFRVRRKSVAYPMPSRLPEGSFAVVTDVRRDAVDVDGASDEDA